MLPALPFRQRARVTAEVVATALATADFVVILAAASSAGCAYFNLTEITPPPRAHFFLTSLLAAVLFVAISERIGGYQLKRLRQLRWQLIHTLVIWCVTTAILLSVAYSCRDSPMPTLGVGPRPGWPLAVHCCWPTAGCCTW